MLYQMWSDDGADQARHEGRLLLPRQPCGCSDRRRAPTACRRAAAQSDTDNLMGLSVGWGDEYPANFAFQWIDISTLPPGDYTVQARADEQNWYVESDETNNCAWSRVRIAEHGRAGRDPCRGTRLRGPAGLDRARRAPVRNEPIRDLSGRLRGRVRARRAGRLRGDRPQLPRRARRRRRSRVPGRPDHPGRLELPAGLGRDRARAPRIPSGSSWSAGRPSYRTTWPRSSPAIRPAEGSRASSGRTATRPRRPSRPTRSPPASRPPTSRPARTGRTRSPRCRTRPGPAGRCSSRAVRPFPLRSRPSSSGSTRAASSWSADPRPSPMPSLAALDAYDTGGGVLRIGGVDRYDTAAMLSAFHHPSGAALAYVATGQNFPDALGAGPAAAVRGAPTILVRGDVDPAAQRRGARSAQSRADHPPRRTHGHHEVRPGGSRGLRPLRRPPRCALACGEGPSPSWVG